MKKFSGLMAFILFFALGMVAFSCSASAYLDPSAMTFVVQAVAGVAIASVTAVGFYMKKLKRKFRRSDEYSPIDTVRSMELTGELMEFDDSEFDLDKNDYPVNPDYTPPVKKEEEEKSSSSITPAPVGFTGKLKALWQDDRKYLNRLAIAALPFALLFFTIIFFGPLEMALSNTDSLIFEPSTVGFSTALTALLYFAVSTVVLSLFRGKIFNYAVSATFGASVAAYAQGTFLNGDLMGALTGDGIAWQGMKIEMATNFIVWAVIFIIPFIIAYFNIKIWKLSVQFVSFVLIAAQIVGVGSLLLPKEEDENKALTRKESDYYLTTDGVSSFSPDHNVLVFLLDRLDYDRIEEIKKDEPDFFDKFDGFVSYNNAISEFARTLPGASHILTGSEENAYLIKAEEYLDNAWNLEGNSILKEIKNKGYDINIFSDIDVMFGTPSKYIEYVSNVSSDTSKINYPRLIKNMTTVSAYKYMPVALKPFFWCYSDDINAGVYQLSTRYQIDDTALAKSLEDISLTSEKKAFKFYHLNGPHAPYFLNADGTKNEQETTKLDQSKGAFTILHNIFNKMKELGIYESSEIFIVADHGDAVSDYKPVQKATAIGLFHKPSGVAGTEFKENSAPVSHKNIPATILRSMGVENYRDFGTPLDEVAEDAQIVRYFYKSVMEKTDGRAHEVRVIKYQITGDAKNFENWKKIDEYNVVDYFY